MQFPWHSVLALGGLLAPTAASAKTLIYQYDPITYVENLAVRPNGKILPTTTTSPLLNQIDPNTGELHPLHDFSAYGNAIQGITAVGIDSYALDVLNCNITELACTQGSVTTHLVSFSTHSQYSHQERVSVHEVAGFPQAGFLNGMASLDPETVLLADSFLGGIWSLNIKTGLKGLLFTDRSMNGTADVATGVNGIRVRGDTLYYTNSARGTFNSITINPATGAKTGKANVITSGLTGPDDFEVDEASSVAYVCNGVANQVLKIGLESGEKDVTAHVPGPTSLRWAGAGPERFLYASDIGGLAQYISRNYTTGGAIYRIDV